nr:hypothetical protein [Tanacetum cinerariifolium]
MELMVFVMKKDVCDKFELNAAHLSKFLLSGKFVVKRSGDVTRLQALGDKKRIVITEEVVREILQLNDDEGVICLPNDEIFAGLARMGYEKPSTKLTFYKAFFSTQVGKGFLGVETPPFETMLAVRDVVEEVEAQILAQGDDV